MSVDRSFVERNKAELARLRTLVAKLSDADMAKSLGDGWTVGAALAHLPFGDQRGGVLLDRWEKEGVKADPYDSLVINRASLPHWLALTPSAIRDLVLKAAEAADKKLEGTKQEILDWLDKQEDPPIRIVRGLHRAEHIEQIERALKQ